MPKPPIPLEINEFLKAPNPAVIATLQFDGSPNTVATWYLWENGRALVNMDESRKRLQFMRRDARVSLTALGKDSWAYQVSLRGKVMSIEEDADLSDIDRISQHYAGKPYSDREHRRYSAWIDVEAWWGWAVTQPWEPD